MALCASHRRYSSTVVGNSWVSYLIRRAYARLGRAGKRFFSGRRGIPGWNESGMNGAGEIRRVLVDPIDPNNPRNPGFLKLSNSNRCDQDPESGDKDSRLWSA